MRRTKIVCTIGPATQATDMITGLLEQGMNVARLNFSHGTHAEHRDVFTRLRATATRMKKPLGILQDLQGPKIRVGVLPAEGVHLVPGAKVCLTTRTAEYAISGEHCIPVSYKELHHDVKQGDVLLLDDGLLELAVAEVAAQDIYATVTVGGKLTSHKGVNVPTAAIKLPALTDKDRADLALGLELGVDFVALSFVKTAAEVLELKQLIAAGWPHAGAKPLVVVKIEKHEALENFADILAAADAVMVARGDLGIETPAPLIPVEQKKLIAAARAAGKPVIVATQMLDSMIRNPRPTRAEVSDIANAVIDGTDACMLSGESASGQYPLEAVQVMAQTIVATEASPFDDKSFTPAAHVGTLAARVESALGMALRSGVQAVIIFTDTGEKARIASSLRQALPLVAVVPTEAVARQLCLSWGVQAFVVPEFSWEVAQKQLQKDKVLLPGKPVVVLGEAAGSTGDLVMIS